MTYDLPAARQAVLGTARLLDRLRLAHLVDGAPGEAVVAALAAYQNADGGFGNGLEPDLRDPASQPVPVHAALEVLAEVDALDSDLAHRAEAWLAGVAHPDGSLPLVLPSAADAPHAPWMAPDTDPSFITLGVLGVLGRSGPPTPWRERARAWCWERVGDGSGLEHYWFKHALAFLDADPDEARALAVIDRMGEDLADDGSIPVPGGTDDERLRPLVLSPHPGSRSRRIFGEEMFERALDAAEAEQRDDGAWAPDYLAWSPAQEVEWRGRTTVDTLVALKAHGR